MKLKHIQIMALIMIQLVLFLPMSMVSALQITHSPNPATIVETRSATVEWNTDEASNSRVDYGPSKQLGAEKMLAGMTTQHTVVLSNLTPNQRYYFQLMSIAASGDYKIDDNSQNFYSFVTRSEGDAVAPEINNITIKSLTETAVTIQWKTNEESTSAIYMGKKGSPLNISKRSSDLVTTHIVTIPAESGVEYNYVVESCDRLNNCRNSTQQFFVGGADTTPPEINVNVPEWHFSGRIDLKGTTEPYARVELYVNGRRTRILQPHQTGASGAINLMNVALPADENNITIKAIDQVGNEVSEDYVVKIDPIPPTLVVTGVPEYANVPSITININISEPSTITFDIGVADQIAPKKISGLKQTRVSSSIVDIEWDENTDTDLDEYAIYRKTMNESGADWIRVAVTKRNTKYQDTKVQPGKSYSYRVSAVDRACNEGAYSSSIALALPGNIDVASGALDITPVNLSCEGRAERIFYDGGSFSKTINLEDGVNNIIITAVDRAGHQVVFRGKTAYDKYPPTFIKTNLGELSPSYIPTVTVTGNVSEKALIYVFVNKDVGAGTAAGPSGLLGLLTNKTYTETDANGGFSVTFDLSRGTPSGSSGVSLNIPVLSLLSGGTGGGAGAAGPVWLNNVTLIAIDESGSPSQPLSAQVVYTTCSTGMGDWRIDIGGQPGSVFGQDGLSPSILNPRMMLEGTEILSFPVNFTYVGPGKGQIMGIPAITKYLPSQAMRDQYMPDYDWVGDPQIMCDNTKTSCFVQMQIRVPDPTPAGENWTMFQQEENVSDNRRYLDGPGGCALSRAGATIAGCVKIPMQIEVDYKTVTERSGPQAEQHFAGSPRTDAKVQKECWEIEVGIDQRLPLDLIPGGLLRGAQGFLNDTVTLIDDILEPLATIKEYMLYACLASWIFSFITNIAYNFQCGGDNAVVNAAIGTLTGTQFDLNVAKAGLCAKAYKDTEGNDNSERRQKCEQCEGSLNGKARLEWFMHHSCDSLFCPSAPTVQKFIKSAKQPTVKIDLGTEGTHYIGDSCGCELTGDGKTCKPTTKKDTGMNTVQRVYEWYSQNPDMDKFGSDKPGNEKCLGPHTARPECCGMEYMEKWGSACGFPYLDKAMFNELKESMCLAAQNTNQPNKVTGLSLSPDGAGEDSVNCNPTINSVAGFCEPDGKKNMDPIPAGTPLKNPSGLSPTVDKDDKGLYVCLFPPQEGQDINKISFCYATTRSTVQSGNAAFQNDFVAVQKDFGFYTPAGWDVTSYFTGDNEQKVPFCSKMATYGVSREGCEAKYDEVKGRIGDPSKEYVVDPTSSLLRTMQCLCITGFEAYLKLWRKVFMALLNCFRAIELTGDGSPGVCQATVSVYICDLIFDFIKCFSEKYSTGSSDRAESSTSSGGFFSSLTKSVSDVSTGVEGRYGSSPMWEAMFVEQKLMHAVCLWAFTGVWDFDVSMLLEGDTSTVVVESIALLSPCDMRYRAFNPVTQPGGLTTWMYHFGVGLIPGADLRYNLKLVCSDDYSCSEGNGFERGRCDCRDGEQTLTVSDPALSGTLDQSGMLDEEIFFLVQAKKQRYNKAVLTWTWTDNNGEEQDDFEECEISLRGGNPPAFCGFDVAHGIYRCSFGFEAGNWIRFNTVRPNYPSGQPSFKLGDKLEFIVDIQQSIPSNPDCVGENCEYTKYLTYEIKRNGQAMPGLTSEARSEFAAKLSTSGQHIHNNFPATLVINKPDFFTGVGTQASAGPKCVKGPAPAGTQGTECAPASCDSICTGDFGVVMAGSSSSEQYIVLAINKTHYQFFDTASTSPRTQPSASFVNTYFQKKSGGAESVLKKILEGGSYTHPSGLQFTIRGDVAVRYSEILFKFNPSSGSTAPVGADLCNQYKTFELAKSRPFTITYKIYDSRLVGGRYERSDQVAQFDGGEVVSSTDFYVVCNDNIAQAGGVGAMCSSRSTTAEQRDCWCTNTARTESKFTATRAYDVGPSFKPVEFCVDNMTSDTKACATDGTATLDPCVCAFNAQNQPIKCPTDDVEKIKKELVNYMDADDVELYHALYLIDEKYIQKSLLTACAYDSKNTQNSKCEFPKCAVNSAKNVTSACICVGTKDGKENKNFCDPFAIKGIACYATGECKEPSAAKPCPTDVFAPLTKEQIPCVCDAADSSPNCFAVGNVCDKEGKYTWMKKQDRPDDSTHTSCLWDALCEDKAESKIVDKSCLCVKEGATSDPDENVNYCFNNPANPADEKSYCCRSSGACVHDPSQCAATGYPVVRFDSTQGIKNEAGAPVDVQAIPVSDTGATLKYTVHFAVDNNARPYQAQITLKEKKASGSFETVKLGAMTPYSGAQNPSMEFTIGPDKGQTEYEFSITVVDQSTGTPITRTLPKRVKTAGVLNKPVLVIEPEILLKSLTEEIDQNDDGFYYLRTGKEYTIEIGMYNYGNAAWLGITPVGYTGTQHTGYISPKRITEVSSATSAKNPYFHEYKFTAGSDTDGYSLEVTMADDIVRENGATPRSIKIKEFVPPVLSEFKLDKTTVKQGENVKVDLTFQRQPEKVELFFEGVGEGALAFEKADFVKQGTTNTYKASKEITTGSRIAKPYTLYLRVYYADGISEDLNSASDKRSLTIQEGKVKIVPTILSKYGTESTAPPRLQFDCVAPAGVTIKSCKWILYSPSGGTPLLDSNPLQYPNTKTSYVFSNITKDSGVFEVLKIRQYQILLAAELGTGETQIASSSVHFERGRDTGTSPELEINTNTYCMTDPHYMQFIAGTWNMKWPGESIPGYQPLNSPGFITTIESKMGKNCYYTHKSGHWGNLKGVDATSFNEGLWDIYSVALDADEDPDNFYTGDPDPSIQVVGGIKYEFDDSDKAFTYKTIYEETSKNIATTFKVFVDNKQIT